MPINSKKRRANEITAGSHQEDVGQTELYAAIDQKMKHDIEIAEEEFMDLATGR